MFYNYEIHNNGKEDILYLYLTMKYEFSDDFSFEDENDLRRRTNNFIQSNNIPFRGSHIYLIVDGIIVKSIDISNAVYQSFSSSYSTDNFMVSIKMEDDSLCEISLRDYLLSILFCYFSFDIHDEVLKCICVLYSGYAYKLMEDQKYIVAEDNFIRYRPFLYYKTIFSSFDYIKKRLNTIISAVDSVFLDYENNYILPFIHYCNSGKTITNSLYPYLSSVQSLWDMASFNYVNVHDFSYHELSTIFKLSLKKKHTISIISKGSSKRIIFENKMYSLNEIKTLLHLKSDNIYFIIYKDFLRVITIGLGNSYGLSIFGANELAKDGIPYYAILNYYFPKTKLFKHVKELSS